MVERAGHDARAAQLRAARLPALSQVDLHLGQPPGLPRRAGRQEAEDRRHRQHRHHRHQGRLPRRHQPHVLRRRAVDPGAAPVRGHLRMHVAAASARCARARISATSAHAIQTHAESARLQRGARVLRPRHRPQVPRGAAGAALRPPGTGLELRAGHDLHHRADDQRRQGRRSASSPTAGPSSPRTTACRRSGSTPCWSPRPATRC